MLERIKPYFVEDDYKYVLENLSNINENKYRLKISVSFYVKNNHYNTRGFLSNDEICKLINGGKGGTGYLLYCYEKLGVIKGFDLCKEKTKEQKDFYDKMKGSEHWDYRVKTDCFDYEIDADIEKLKFFGRAVFQNVDYGIPTRCLNELIGIIEDLNIKYDEILDFLKIGESSPHCFKSNSLIVFSLGSNSLLLEKLFNFIEIIASEHASISKKIGVLRKLIDESGKKGPGVYITKGKLTINGKDSDLRGDQKKICEEIFREPGKRISKTELLNKVYRSDEKDRQLDEQIKKINVNKIYPISSVGGIRQESGDVFYDKDYSRKN